MGWSLPGAFSRLLLAMVMVMVLPAYAFPAEVSGIVTNVEDGNTFDLSIVEGDPRITASLISVRLADLVCPDIATAEGQSSRYYAQSILQDRLVYLDIDDKSGQDSYGRWVAVVYLSDFGGFINRSLNFNRILVDSGHACILDLANNEFEPASWWGGYIPISACIDSSLQRPIISSDDAWAYRGSGEKGRPDPYDPSKRISGSYIGDRVSGAYHYPSCYWASQISSENRMWFNSPEEAISYGYWPCQICNPPTGAYFIADPVLGSVPSYPSWGGVTGERYRGGDWL